MTKPTTTVQLPPNSTGQKLAVYPVNVNGVDTAVHAMTLTDSAGAERGGPDRPLCVTTVNRSEEVQALAAADLGTFALAGRFAEKRVGPADRRGRTQRGNAR